ncbi:MAG TPA: DUF4404 family protein [Anaerolineales bacterium]
MDEQHLRDQLEQLNREIEQTQAADDEQRERLESLRDNVQAALDRPSQEQPPHYGSLIEELRQAIQQFEVTYPNLTLTMDRILDILSQSGI